MTNTARDLAIILERAGVGTIGTDIFATPDIPPKPDEIIYLTITGTEDATSVNLDYSYPKVQVIVRGSAGGLLSVWDRVEQVHSVLHGKVNAVVETRRYVLIDNANGPIDLGFDDTMRVMAGETFKSIVTTYSPHHIFSSRLIGRVSQQSVVTANLAKEYNSLEGDVVSVTSSFGIITTI